MVALAGWWLRFWVKIVVLLLLRGPGEEEERGAFGEARDFEFEAEKSEVRGVCGSTAGSRRQAVVAVDSRGWPAGGAATSSRSKGWCFGGSSTVNSR